MEELMMRYAEMIKKIETPFVLTENLIRMTKQFEQNNDSIDLYEEQSVSHFCIDEYLEPTIVIWKNGTGYSVDYYWAVSNFSKICEMVIEGNQTITVVSDGKPLFTIVPINQTRGTVN